MPNGNTNNTTTKWQEVGLYLLQYKYGDMRYGNMLLKVQIR